MDKKARFIEKAIKKHGNKYDYSKVDYKSCKEKVCIICPIHGEFWQTPDKHLREHGCPKCKESHLEEKIRVLLENNNIEYKYDCSNKAIGCQRFDFYLPQYNIAIECQGIQHFKPSSFSSKVDGKKMFQMVKKRDKEKFQNAKKHNIKIIYFSDLKYNSFFRRKSCT